MLLQHYLTVLPINSTQKNKTMQGKLMALSETILMTVFSYLLMITWLNVLTVIPVLLSTLFWVKKIKHTQIVPHYKGSWVLWFKSFLKFKRKD